MAGYFFVGSKLGGSTTQVSISWLSVVGTITCDGDGIPEAYPCLGRVADLDRSLYKYWYRVRVGNKTGYVNASLMLWRPFF